MKKTLSVYLQLTPEEQQGASCHSQGKACPKECMLVGGMRLNHPAMQAVKAASPGWRARLHVFVLLGFLVLLVLLIA